MKETIHIEERTLKSFKQQLKSLLRESTITEFLIQVQYHSCLYKARLVADLLFVILPGSKTIDGIIRPISRLSKKRKRKTIAVFLQKRLAIGRNRISSGYALKPGTGHVEAGTQLFKHNRNVDNYYSNIIP